MVFAVLIGGGQVSGPPGSPDLIDTVVQQLQDNRAVIQKPILLQVLNSRSHLGEVGLAWTEATHREIDDLPFTVVYLVRNAV